MLAANASILEKNWQTLWALRPRKPRGRSHFQSRRMAQFATEVPSEKQQQQQQQEEEDRKKNSLWIFITFFLLNRFGPNFFWLAV
jgi:hypothetical protein